MKFLLLNLMFLVPAFAQAHIFIGNGGEGVQVGDKLYVRDLFEQGTHLNPVFGNRIDSELEKRIRHSRAVVATGVSANLWVRKLTDLNQNSALLGNLVLEALEKYTLKFTQTPLPLLPDDFPRSDIPPSSRVQIANRLFRTITIHQPSWQILSPEHQVALLVHETLYGLSKVSCDSKGSCEQASKPIREITGLAFSAKMEDITSLVSERLELDENFRSCQPDNYDLSLGLWRQVDGRPQDPQLFTLKIQSPVYSAVTDSFGRLCEELKKQTRGNYYVSFGGIRRAFRMEAYSYETPAGTAQQGVRLIGRNFRTKRFILNPSACEERLQTEFLHATGVNSSPDIFFSPEICAP